MAVDLSEELTLPGFGNFTLSQLPSLTLNASSPNATAEDKERGALAAQQLLSHGIEPIAYDDAGQAPPQEDWFNPSKNPPSIKIPTKPVSVTTPNPALQAYYRPLGTAARSVLGQGLTVPPFHTTPKYSPISGAVSPADVNYDCPDGFYYDGFWDMCFPLSQEPTQVQQPGTVSNEPVSVTINNSVLLSKGVGQAISDAVTFGIEQAVDQAKEAASEAANAVVSSIQDVVTTLKDGFSGFVSQLYDTFKHIGSWISDHLDTIIGFLKDHIGQLIDTVKDVFNNVIVPVFKDIQTAIHTVNDVINNTIAPIFRTIQDVYKTTTALIDAIKQDVDAGLTGILQLPTDISNALGSLDASLQRAFQLLGLKTTDDVSVFTSPNGKDSIWHRLSHIGDGMAVLGGLNEDKITFGDTVKLSEPNLSRAGAKSIDALGTEISDYIHDLVAGGTSTLNASKTAITSLPILLAAEAFRFVGVWQIIRAMDSVFEPFYDFAKDDLRSKAGLGKLPVSAALDSWRRGFIKDNDLTDELAVNGWDATRIRVLKDLQQYVMDIERTVDLYYRGMITKDDLSATFRQHGIDGYQRDAIIDQAKKLFDVQLAATSRRWGLIDDAAIDAVLRQHRYTDTEITAFKETLFEPETVAQVIQRERLQILYSGLGYSPEGFSTPSNETLAASLRAGADATSALADWQASYFVQPLQEWIVGHFRGIYTRRELDAAMDYYRVPGKQRDSLIGTHRALIPFRTIPTMLANGIIDESYAKNQLYGHGFDIVAAEALIKYGQVAHNKQIAAASGDIAGLSVAVARGYFDQETLDEQQYKSVLMAHGYSEQAASLTVKVETQHRDMLQRRDLARDIVAEANAGTITQNQAEAQMDSAHFTPAEKAKAMNALHRQRRQVNKVPAEAELHSMAKAGAIGIDDYRAGLKSSGWSDSWISNFVKWRFPSAASTPSTA